MYFYDEYAPAYAKHLQPSGRGELEITDLNKIYLESGAPTTKRLGRGCTWLDTGTIDSLIEAQQFVHVIEKRQGQKIACPEEVAMRKGFISEEAFASLAANASDNLYGQYLRSLIKK